MASSLYPPDPRIAESLQTHHQRSEVDSNAVMVLEERKTNAAEPENSTYIPARRADKLERALDSISSSNGSIRVT